MPLVQQAKLLAKQYDAVIANPPYMGGKGMNTALKDFAKKKFPDSKSDLFAMFIERGFSTRERRQKLLRHHARVAGAIAPHAGRSAHGCAGRG